MTSPALRVPARFNGPPESANGGWFSGHLAQLLDTGAVTVRLHAPPPMERDLTVVRDGDGLGVHDGDHVIARAMSADRFDGTVVQPPIPWAAADAVGAAYEGLVNHPFPTCYSCGTARADGLGLRPGRVPDGDGEYAAAWRAREVTPEVVWAALDCPGGWSAGIAGRPMVLGTMTARVVDLPAEGEECVVMAWPRGGAGRKFHSAAALYGTSDRLLARAEAVWIAVDPSTVRPLG